MNSFSVLSLAFGLGLLHALDADHIMAVSGLSARRQGFSASLQFCLRWAIGHGFSLFLIGGSVLLLGMAIPASLSVVAEMLVGLVLIGIGLWVIWELISRRAHMHFHHHDNIPRHAHWHVHKDQPNHQSRHETRHNSQHKRTPHTHEHSAVLVGVLHGTAGSAPLLALIPLANLGDSPWLGMAYLLLFSCGVLVSMLIFGGLLGSTVNWLSRWGDRTVQLLRTSVAISSIGFGAFLLQASLSGSAA
jgi:ABC-type nickel/cobalt efflux system permease component RcnA